MQTDDFNITTINNLIGLFLKVIDNNQFPYGENEWDFTSVTKLLHSII